MPKITLAQAKAHLRVDDSDEDALIVLWLAAAYRAIEGKIFRRVHDGDVPEEDPTGIVVGEDINAAALLILGHLHTNREAVSLGQMVEVPMGAMWLLEPYINTAEGY